MAVGQLPPGWRDDELINSLVISQHVLDGDFAVYYADASGHEALYHALNAIMLGLFGANFVGIRLLSAFLGTLAVPLTFQVGRKLFGWVGLTAAAGLAVSLGTDVRSLWPAPRHHAGFDYGRILLFLARLSAGRWAIRNGRSKRFNLQSPVSISYYLISALFVALGFYTYFAGRACR
ncbi:MAG: hypothetical protein H6656_07330 [Ardenticatenaceae bacterium]|nr:hypothetical protein [Ardenticatenaceae bacterium]